MKPVDYRNETWDSLRARLTSLRLTALMAWRAHGPGTTREVAQRSGFDLLSFRPRTTELVQIGLVDLVPVAAADNAHCSIPNAQCHEGIYYALSDAMAHVLFLERQLAAQGIPRQRELALP